MICNAKFDILIFNSFSSKLTRVLNKREMICYQLRLLWFVNHIWYGQGQAWQNNEVKRDSIYRKKKDGMKEKKHSCMLLLKQDLS